MDHRSRSRVRAKKGARDRLIRLAATRPDWALGLEDEAWWSRLARPALHAWAEPDRPPRLVEQAVAKDAPDPKAPACYGRLVRWWERPDRPPHEPAWLRFVDGRPVSGVTTPSLAWRCEQRAAVGKTALLLVWDSASWHVSQQVRGWIRQHNRDVKHAGHGVRSVTCPLPIKAPWLNPIEPTWAHGKRRVAEADGLPSARALAERVCAACACPYAPPLSMPEKVA